MKLSRKQNFIIDLIVIIPSIIFLVIAIIKNDYIYVVGFGIVVFVFMVSIVLYLLGL